MNIQILAERKAKALNKIAECAKGVSKATGAPDYLLEGLVVTNKDKDVEGMLRMEAVAGLMEWLRGVPPAEPMSDVDQILALPAAKVIEFVNQQNDPVYIGALLFGEDNGKKRKGVLAATEARAQVLTTVTPSEQADPAPTPAPTPNPLSPFPTVEGENEEEKG